MGLKSYPTLSGKKVTNVIKKKKKKLKGSHHKKSQTPSIGNTLLGSTKPTHNNKDFHLPHLASILHLCFLTVYINSGN